METTGKYAEPVGTSGIFANPPGGQPTKPGIQEDRYGALGRAARLLPWNPEPADLVTLGIQIGAHANAGSLKGLLK